MPRLHLRFGRLGSPLENRQKSDQAQKNQERHASFLSTRGRSDFVRPRRLLCCTALRLPGRKSPRSRLLSEGLRRHCASSRAPSMRHAAIRRSSQPLHSPIAQSRLGRRSRALRDDPSPKEKTWRRSAARRRVLWAAGSASPFRLLTFQPPQTRTTEVKTYQRRWRAVDGTSSLLPDGENAGVPSRALRDSRQGKRSDRPLHPDAGNR